MPIAGWVCRGCGGREVALDHFKAGPCSETVCPERYANAVIDHEQGHYSAGSTTPSVTVLLGCPRSWKLRQSIAYWVDPVASNAALTGTAYHDYVGRLPGKHEVREAVMTGVVNGITISGRADSLYPYPELIEDDKHKSDWSEKQVRANGAQAEHVAQLGLYAELVHQRFGWRPKRGIIWYHWSTNGGLFPAPVDPLWSLDQVLTFKPHYGKYSVAGLLEQTQEARWEDMPLAGESQVFSGNKTMCSYCPVRPACFEQAKGANF